MVLQLRMAAAALQLLLAGHADSLRGAPEMRLTALGETLTAAQRAWLHSNASQVVRGGAFAAPTFDRNRTANATSLYYTPDDKSDPRKHYPAQYVRDFTYTFTMAPDLVPGDQVANILDWLADGQSNATGEMPEGGVPPSKAGCSTWGPDGCLDNGPYICMLRLLNLSVLCVCVRPRCHWHCRATTADRTATSQPERIVL